MTRFSLALLAVLAAAAAPAAAQTNAFGRPGALGQGPIGGAPQQGQTTSDPQTMQTMQTMQAPAPQQGLPALPTAFSHRGWNGTQQARPAQGQAQPARTTLPRGPLRPWIRYYGR